MMIFCPCLTHADECHYCGSDSSMEVMQKKQASDIVNE